MKKLTLLKFPIGNYKWNKEFISQIMLDFQNPPERFKTFFHSGTTQDREQAYLVRKRSSVFQHMYDDALDLTDILGSSFSEEGSLRKNFHAQAHKEGTFIHASRRRRDSARKLTRILHRPFSSRGPISSLRRPMSCRKTFAIHNDS